MKPEDCKLRRVLREIVAFIDRTSPARIFWRWCERRGWIE